MNIPSVKFDEVKKLSQEEAYSIFESKIRQHGDYKKLVENIPSFNEEALEVLSANKIKLTINNQADEVYEATRLVLRFGEVLFNYQISTSDDMEKEDILSAIVNKEEKTVKTLVVNQNKIDIKQFSHEEEINIAIDMDDFKVDKEQNVIAQYEWGDGCYPFYKHCGKNCGDNGNWGGGTPINSYDTCCRTHDRCWANFGTNDCGCDCNLLSCAKSNWYYAPVALHVIVLAYFPVRSSCSC